METCGNKDELISEVLQLSLVGGGAVIITANDWQLLIGAYGANELVRKIGERALFVFPVRSVPSGELSFRERSDNIIKEQ